MGRLIDASVLQEEYKKRHDGKRLLLIDVAPTVEAVPVAHGRWKAVTDDGDEYIRICSCCGEEAPYDNEDEGPLSEGYYLLYPHCPWCGAKMDGKDGDHAEGTI